ncbi:putative RNA-directed DNA polymerase (Reverse transcriptase), Ribonuclease H [Cucumis melo var. makuwa]|uniref:RNA-directed DNA polymerase (Reverse transcriptase), Ribonuclease H n=1 Tax=Cucumis melo var. makuwa TaxID=1194695 RepID=A0A5A7VG92_CUCMM|nr:putative RNA-directed DNA polymerase (Reverse transcriptase), Ribonuclease H [Cucumis melo var. makuwa]
MPFGLKNAGATYQRAMVTLFHDMMHKEIEVYVDDMIAKSKSPPVLIPPAPGRPLILYLTVLESSMGGVLGQHDLSGKKEHAIYYLSKKFTDYESRYTMLERTCCALGSAVADHLAAQPVADYEPMRIDFSDDNIFLIEKNARDHETWTMLFDGVSNELGHGIGVVLISPEGKVFPLTAKLCFECTHNIAEYEACIMGLQVVCDMSIKKLKVLGDSMEDNRMADALATLAVMFDLNLEFELHPIQITKRDVPAYCMNVGNDNKPWYFDIKQYIKCREYPYEALENDKRTIRRLAMNFFLSGEVLYKRNHDMVLLRCVDEEEAKQIMTDIYEGICGTHANGHMMARQILRSGYYWTTMESDCIKYARECKKCQIYMDKIHVAASPLHILSAPWPFSLWGMDVIGPIDPKASNGHRFILVAIDYFTKWIEAASYCNVTRGVVLKFIKKQLICRYGLP